MSEPPSIAAPPDQLMRSKLNKQKRLTVDEENSGGSTRRSRHLAGLVQQLEQQSYTLRVGGASPSVRTIYESARLSEGGLCKSPGPAVSAAMRPSSSEERSANP